MSTTLSRSNPPIQRKIGRGKPCPKEYKYVLGEIDGFNKQIKSLKNMNLNAKRNYLNIVKDNKQEIKDIQKEIKQLKKKFITPFKRRKACKQ